MSSVVYRYTRSFWVKNIFLRCDKYTTTVARWCHDTFHKGSIPSTRVRNIGIMAHIDAGKTTTTERMLFYSGISKHLGNVDHGDTVTDYMEQERNRGITITSAAVTFYWNEHKINLIDTPGHVDFTVEVERCVRVLDGAITVIDASAGVEAQTVTVWKQAQKYGVPCIAYLNKMDKAAADFEYSITSIRDRLKAVPVVLQFPVTVDNKFCGVLDLITLNKITWDLNDNSFGTKFKVEKLTEAEELYSDAIELRTGLIDLLTDLDDKIADYVLNDTNYDDIPVLEIIKALRRITLAKTGLPIVCGSSLKNCGVQLLMDAINHYLPSPNDIKHEFMEFYGNQLCAMAFKLIFDKQRGPLTFLRLYSGIVNAGQEIFNANRDIQEVIGRVIRVYADEYQDLTSAEAGDIVAVTGLSETVTGDTIINASNFHHESKSPMLAGLDIPEPVFFCTVETDSRTHQENLNMALEKMQKEDPSLKVWDDPDTGDTIMAGMGELHLEIVKDRLIKEYKVEAYMGPLQVAYKECISEGVTETVELVDTNTGNLAVGVTLELTPTPNVSQTNNIKYVDHHTPGIRKKERLALKTKWDRIHKKQKMALESGIKTGLLRGSLLGFPVLDVTVHIQDLVASRKTPLAQIGAAGARCVRSALRKTEGTLLEPLMQLEIYTNSRYNSVILKDLKKRRSQIHGIDSKGDVSIIHSTIPVSETMGYVSVLRKITSGMATCTMELSGYQTMTSHEQEDVLERRKLR